MITSCHVAVHFASELQNVLQNSHLHRASSRVPVPLGWILAALQGHWELSTSAKIRNILILEANSPVYHCHCIRCFLTSCKLSWVMACPSEAFQVRVHRTVFGFVRMVWGWLKNHCLLGFETQFVSGAHHHEVQDHTAMPLRRRNSPQIFSIFHDRSEMVFTMKESEGFWKYGSWWRWSLGESHLSQNTEPMGRCGTSSKGRAKRSRWRPSWKFCTV